MRRAALSVSCADSSPKGRAKALRRVAEASNQSVAAAPSTAHAVPLPLKGEVLGSYKRLMQPRVQGPQIRETRIVAYRLLAISSAPPACFRHWRRQASAPWSF